MGFDSRLTPIPQGPATLRSAPTRISLLPKFREGRLGALVRFGTEAISPADLVENTLGTLEMRKEC